MRIFPPTIEVADDEGFTHDKDIFKRAEFGKGLASLVGAVDDPLVMVLDGPWGSGKTTFIKMWAGLLRNSGHPVIYFDAFANDYIDDAFLAIAGEVIALSQAKKKERTAAHRKFLEKASRAGRAILRSGAKIGVKAATLGALDAADIAELKLVAKDIADEASAKSDDYIKTLLLRQGEERQNIEGLRKSLAELAIALGTSATGGEKVEAKTIIFIVDELDRCKPSFALELLEKIKHVFSVEGVHFVLVTHLPQLENSVRFAYGAQIDARTYLQKFYNLIVNLPADGKYESEWAASKFLNYAAQSLPHDRNALDFAKTVARAKGLTLRHIERIMTYIALSIVFTTSKTHNFFMPGPILGGLCVLKAIEPELFQKAKSGNLTFEETLDAFGFSRWPEGHSKEWSQKWWKFALADKIEENEMPSFDSLARFGIDDRRDVVPTVANGIVDRMQIPKE